MQPIHYIFIYSISLLIIGTLWGRYIHWKISVCLYLWFFLAACGFISIFFFTVSDGIFRDYSNLSLDPFLYLILGYIITMFPLMAYDSNQSKTLTIYQKQDKIINNLCIFLIVLSIEPFIEQLLKLQQVAGNINYMANMYEATGDDRNIISTLGSKLFNLYAYFELLFPILLIYQFTKKEINKKMVLGIVIVIIGYWLHEVLLGGRSKLVQNLLYTIVVYLIMRPYINKERNIKIMKYGTIVISIGLLGMLAVTLSRFVFNSSSTQDNIWSWLSLYAGEGSINFNSSMWYVTKTTNGNSSFILLMHMLGLTDKIGVNDQWDAVESLGIQGNIFYTYIGVFFCDLGKWMTIIYISIASYITYRLSRCKKHIYLPQIIILCFCARILCLPTFYTFGTYMSQINLSVALIFCLLLHLNQKGKILL